MSAFNIDHEHINVLVWAGLKDPRLGPLRWYWGTPTISTELHPETAAATGQMLLDANADTLGHLYSDHGPYPAYTYRAPLHHSWTELEILNALHCYRYNSCEHPGWEDSPARAFVDALEARLIHRLPGYTSGPWAIGPESLPAAAKRTA